jgi:hypothetical protein
MSGFARRPRTDRRKSTRRALLTATLKLFELSMPLPIWSHIFAVIGGAFFGYPTLERPTAFAAMDSEAGMATAPALALPDGNVSTQVWPGSLSSSSHASATFRSSEGRIVELARGRSRVVERLTGPPYHRRP